MKAHHALGAFSFVGMLALVYGAWTLCTVWGWPALGQILALIIGATWIWALMDADKSLAEETRAENRQIGTLLQDLAHREHEHHKDAQTPKPWHG